ncbi:MAG: DUF547 domain-containing protein [Phycisphaerae bacterium]|nr:DUF547 domain-containing protein [Phycisphaerae bacterium]
MGFIRRFKISLISLCVFLSVLFLCPSSFVSSLHAEENRPNSEESSKEEIKKDQVSPPEETVDPNGLPEDFDDENDDFSPRISTYVKINETYEKIFNPDLITKGGLVNYSTLRRKRNDLILAMKELKDLNPAVLMTLDKNQRIAFWINTYNICTLKLVVDNYPIEPKIYMIFYPDNSIMQISGNWRTKTFFKIQGLEYTLEEIEQDFLLKRYEDPRICFALSYASLGGATLRNEPYTAEKLDEQLDDQVKQYLTLPRGLQFDKEANILYLSNLFTMHQHRELFLSSEYASIMKFRDRKPEEQAWLNFLWNYLSEDDKRYLETTSPAIKFIKYDWLLNEIH